MDHHTAHFTQEYLAEDNSAPLLETCICFLVFETLFMGFLYTSRYLAKAEQANLSMVLLMTAGYLVCVAKISIGFLFVKTGGAGRHLAALDLQAIQSALKLQTALQIVCPLTTSFTKLGVLCLFYQILGRTSKRLRIIIQCTFAFVLVILIVQLIIPFANCKPFSKTWEPSPNKEDWCAISRLSLWRYLSIPNVLSMIIVVCIPLPSLYHLKVNAATKFGLALVFAVCVMGITAAIMRFQSFLKVTNFNDITYEIIKPLCWTIAESGIYLIAGVMLTLRPLVRRIFKDVPFDKILSATFRSSGSWGNKRASQMLPKGEKPLPPEPKSQKPFTDMSSKGTVIVMMDQESLIGSGSEEGRR